LHTLVLLTVEGDMNREPSSLNKKYSYDPENMSGIEDQDIIVQASSKRDPCNIRKEKTCGRQGDAEKLPHGKADGDPQNDNPEKNRGATVIPIRRTGKTRKR
jgi:hypothetical protein